MPFVAEIVKSISELSSPAITAQLWPPLYVVSKGHNMFPVAAAPPTMVTFTYSAVVPFTFMPRFGYLRMP